MPVGSAEAHVLKSDGSVGAVLHVSPDDDPVAGVSTEFFFELKDKDGKFIPEDCDCTATVLQDGKAIYTQSLFQDKGGASFSYVLPQKGIYIVQINGKPNSQNAFQPFTLSWDIRVAREEIIETPAKEGIDTNIVWYSVLLVMVVVVGIIVSKRR